MRLVISTIFVAFSVILSAQGWEEVPLVDDFGDLTGEVVRTQYCEGTFSNSATADSEMTAQVTIGVELVSIDLFEYNRRPGARLSTSDALGKIKVKRADGTIEEHVAFATKGAGLYFIDGTGGSFMELVMNGKDELITVLIKQEDFSDYGSASYRFKMRTTGSAD